MEVKPLAFDEANRSAEVFFRVLQPFLNSCYRTCVGGALPRVIWSKNGPSHSPHLNRLMCQRLVVLKSVP